MKSAYPAALCTALLLALPSAGFSQAQPQLRVRPAPPPPAAPATPDQAEQSFDRFARARDNLTMLRDGRRQVSDLTPQELQDVIDFDRMLRGNAAETPTPRQQCVEDEVRRAGGNPSRLAWQVIRLKCR